MKDIYDDAVKNVHCIAGLTIAVEAVPGLIVADIADTLSRLLAAIGMGANRTVGSQGEPTSAVTAEYIPRQQGLSRGIQGHRAGFFFLIDALIHKLLSHLEYFFRDDLEFWKHIG